MREFEKRRVVYGTLKSGDHVLQGVRCEIYLNEVRTSDMKAEVFDLTGSIGGRFSRDFLGREVSFRASGGREQITYTGTVVSSQAGGGSDQVGTIRLDECTEDIYLNRDPIVNASFIFHVTPIDLFARRRGLEFNSQRGLLAGWDFWSDEKNPKWTSEEFSYETHAGDLTLYPGFVFAQPDGSSVLVRDQMMARSQITGNNLSIEGKQKEITDALNLYLHIISLLERRFVDWFSISIDARGESGKGMIRTVYRNVPTLEYQIDHYVQNNAPSYRRLLAEIFKAYQSLTAEKRSELDKAIKQMLIGTVPKQSVEIELIYWHSCLDILIKILAADRWKERKQQGFTKNLVLACEDAGIDWMDLYGYVKRDDIFSETKADLKITTFRNNMIHEGIYPSDEEYRDVFAENSRAAALFERMVMSMIGLDYRQTALGKLR
jgi:hypothetical protein